MAVIDKELVIDEIEINNEVLKNAYEDIKKLWLEQKSELIILKLKYKNLEKENIELRNQLCAKDQINY